MFLDTGLRLSELINLDLEGVDLNTMSVRVRNGKGGNIGRSSWGELLRERSGGGPRDGPSLPGLTHTLPPNMDGDLTSATLLESLSESLQERA